MVEECTKVAQALLLDLEGACARLGRKMVGCSCGQHGDRSGVFGRIGQVDELGRRTLQPHPPHVYVDTRSCLCAGYYSVVFCLCACTLAMSLVNLLPAKMALLVFEALSGGCESTACTEACCAGATLVVLRQ